MRQSRKQTIISSSLPQPVRIVCPQCQYTYEDKYTGKFTTSKCPNCFTIFGINEKGKPTRQEFFYKRFRDVVAFGTDRQTGREVALDTRGRRVDPSETRYDPKKDPHGWKATGRKVKGHERQ